METWLSPELMETIKLIIEDDALRLLKNKYLSALVYASVMLGTVFFGLLLVFGTEGVGVPVFIKYTGYAMLFVSLVMLVRPSGI